MTDLSEDEVGLLLERWREGDRDDYAWFALLREPMRRAARAGIQRMTGKPPDLRDVDDALAKAFWEFLEKDSKRIHSPLGLAVRIAFRRGQDMGRSINHRKEFPGSDQPEIMNATGPALDPEEEVVEAEEKERVLRLARDCLRELSEGQVEVIKATVLGQQNLSDWANETGKSYQAADQQRNRALKALRRCVQSKLDKEGGGHVD